MQPNPVQPGGVSRPSSENVRVLMAEKIDAMAPIVDWDTFYNQFFLWRQGQHVAMVGPTGSGKSTLALNILPKRAYVAMLGTKPHDDTLERFAKEANYKRMDGWKDLSAETFPRRLVWPNAKSLYSAGGQHKAFKVLFEKIYHEGSWCVYIDELWFIIHHLKLEFEVRTYLYQARAMNISLVCATQRPAHVPLEIYDQSTWLFFWRDNDERNLARLSGISWRSSSVLKNLIANLDEHQLLCVNTRTGDMVRTTAPAETVRKEGKNARAR